MKLVQIISLLIKKHRGYHEHRQRRPLELAPLTVHLNAIYCKSNINGTCSR